MSEPEASASETAAQKATEAANQVFQEALRNYENALKSGIELQEESVNLWKSLLTQLGSPEEFQAKLASMQSEVFPAARKRMEEFVELFNRSSNQTLELFEKSLSVYKAKSMTDAQRRLQELMESSLSTLRGNVQTAMNTNAKMITSWKDMLERFSSTSK